MRDDLEFKKPNKVFIIQFHSFNSLLSTHKKAEFVPVKPLTQTEMAVLGLGEIWEKTQREVFLLQVDNDSFFAS